MKAHVVDLQNRRAYAAALDDMHRQRHRLFVDILGWTALARPDEMDIDAFDTDAATYLLILDDAGALRGSARFLPTTQPHMLSQLFPEFLDAAPPRGPAILEWTRHAPGDPDWPTATNTAVRVALHLGVLEFARLRGVTAFTGLLETWLVRRARAMGWPCMPLGPIRRYGEGEAMAVFNPVRPGHLEQLREKVGWHEPVLIDPRAEAA